VNERARAGSVWIHFAVLIGAIVGTDALRSGETFLLAVLYGWMPILAGVAVAIRPATARSVVSSLGVASMAALLMVGLDIGESYQGHARSSGAFLYDGQVQEVERLAGVVSESWALTAITWVEGNLQRVNEQAVRYEEGHPRLVAVEALDEFSMVPLCFAAVGIVLGVCSWLARHARFDSRANEAGARIAIAWLVSAAVMLLSQGAVSRQRFEVLFGGSALWTVLLPTFGFLALGAVGFWMAARSDEGRSAEHP
jgi:hypothetical protein